jgi:ATP-dependent Lon protease
MSYLKSHAKSLALDASRFNKTDVHIHVPAGAVPKDGPSAGVAIAAALISLFRDEPIQTELAMTGEVTLTGRVLPVGGVRDKILAARRAGIRTLLIPRHNEKDLVELPPEVKADLTFRLVDTLDDVVPRLFEVRSVKSKRKPDPIKSKAPALTTVKAPKISPQTTPKTELPATKLPRRPRTV